MRNVTAGLLNHDAVATSIERVILCLEVVRLTRLPRSAEGRADMAHRKLYSTRHTLQMEREVRDMAAGMVADTGHPLSAQAIENKVTELLVAGYPLSEEQIEAIRAVTSSSGRVAIIKGAAGSGKTTTLRPIADLYREHGSDIIATGVAWRTVVALGNDVAARPFCVDKLLRLPDHEDYDTWRNVTDFAVGRCGGLMDDPGRYAIHLDYIVLREVSLGSALSRVSEVLEDDDRHLATILAGQREGESIRSREEFVARLINDLEKLRELRQQRAERKAERQQQSKGRHWSMRM